MGRAEDGARGWGEDRAGGFEEVEGRCGGRVVEFFDVVAGLKEGVVSLVEREGGGVNWMKGLVKGDG